MSIYKVNPGDYEVFTLATNPKSYFASSSSGITGSIDVNPINSHVIKLTTQVTQSSAYLPHDDSSSNHLDEKYDKLKKAIASGNTNISNQLLDYLSSLTTAQSHNPQVGVKRLVPMYSGSMEYVNYLKQSIFGTLSKSYSHTENDGLSYPNYHSLRFIKDGDLTPRALLYPNTGSNPFDPHPYTLTGSFTISFNVKIDSTSSFVAGTIAQLSGNYAVSVVSGTIFDTNGLPNSFGLQLQLSSSATKNPATAYPGDMCYRFDNVITDNDWHNVVFRWGTSAINQGTGSLLIDGIQKSTFVLPSSSFSNELTTNRPSFLSIGNFFSSPNTESTVDGLFFSTIDSSRYGVAKLSNSSTSVSYAFSSQAYFEIHDICIRNDYVADVNELSSTPVLPDQNVKFYLPPFFNENTAYKIPNSGLGGMRSYVNLSGSTSTPFNVGLAFGKGIHYMNVENFTTDYANLNSARHIGFDTYGIFTSHTNDTLPNYSGGANVPKRNLLVIPCDDGSFTPIQGNTTGDVRQTLLTTTLASINLDAMISGSVLSGSNTIPTWVTNNYAPGLDQSKSITDQQEIDNIYKGLGQDPSSLIVVPSTYNNINDWANLNEVTKKLVSYDRMQPTAFFYRFRDPSTTQVVFFDVSNLYYGDSILPGSFVVTDNNLTGSSNTVSITLKDDGMGGLYRANCQTPATFNKVGNIFYKEGIIVIKNPSLYFFGKDQYEMSFRGKRNVHVLKLETMMPRNQVNQSSNPSYIDGLRPSADQIDENQNFIYVTGVNFHDDNLNIVLRSKLAQPIIKREGDKILIRSKIDF